MSHLHRLLFIRLSLACRIVWKIMRWTDWGDLTSADAQSQECMFALMCITPMSANWLEGAMKTYAFTVRRMDGPLLKVSHFLRDNIIFTLVEPAKMCSWAFVVLFLCLSCPRGSNAGLRQKSCYCSQLGSLCVSGKKIIMTHIVSQSARQLCRWHQNEGQVWRWVWSKQRH